MKDSTNLKRKKNKVRSIKINKKVFKIIVLVFLVELLLFPTSLVLAKNGIIGKLKLEASPEEVVLEKEEGPVNNFPQADIVKAIRTGYYSVTAYNSEVGQCDDTPCITANGFNLCEHGIEDTVATNALKFGTKVRMPELFGDRVFIVRDRMNKRYTDRFDIWMKEKKDAINFGLKVVKIEILEG